MPSRRPIRLAVVDDSSFIRQAIVKMMGDEPRVKVVGTAASGEEALDSWEDWKPEVVTLDLAMPGMGGLATLDRIVDRGDAQVIILSTHSGHGAPQTIEALNRGAADFIDKQEYSLLDFAALRGVLADRIVAVSRIEQGKSSPVALGRAQTPQANDFEVLLIGASTGGPAAIEEVLCSLGEDCPVPCLVVQHMPDGFVGAFAQRLNSLLPLGVFEARQGTALEPRTVHLGPAGRHLSLVRQAGNLTVRLREEPARHLHRPSVDVLFESAARVVGQRTLALLLTGMGRDGAAGLAELRTLGAHTLVQDESTSIVFGMPRAAIDLGAACEVHPLHQLGPRVRDLLSLTTDR